jgi:hypothetical protein
MSGEARRRVEPPTHSGRGPSEHHLERRPDVPLEEMSAVRGAAGAPEDDAGVEPRSILAEPDVADKREHLERVEDAAEGRSGAVEHAVAVEAGRSRASWAGSAR